MAGRKNVYNGRGGGAKLCSWEARPVDRHGAMCEWCGGGSAEPPVRILGPRSRFGLVVHGLVLGSVEGLV